MKTNRRKFLQIIGGGTVVAAAAAGGFLTTRTPNKALVPWELAGGYAEPRRRALSYAILSPNPHNRQPWLVDLGEEDKIKLYVDTDKLLPHTDPINRQICIGLGCFLELLRMAAADDGYEVTIDTFPEGSDVNKLDNRLVAEVSFVKNSATPKDPLFKQVLTRRSLKEPYDLSKEVPTSAIDALNTVGNNSTNIGTTNQSEQVAVMRKLTHEALAIEIETPRTYKESVDLFRIGKAEINANPDGIDLGGPLFDSLALAGLFNREIALDTESSAYQQGIDAVMANVDTAMGYVWIITDTNNRNDQLNAGRDWIRINLKTTELGIGLHPISQILQEYPEMSKKYQKIHQLLKAEGKTVQMLGRLGYAAPVAPSPRWPIEAKIIKA